MKLDNIDLDKDVFIIAELSSNHANSLDVALKSLKSIKECGADAVKFQTYTPQSMSLNCSRDDFVIKQGTIWDKTTFYDLYKEACMPYEWYDALFEEAQRLNLIAFSSVFDFDGVDFLDRFNPSMYKIASFEITDIPLIEYVAKRKKPIIISTGIADKEDIALAVKTCKSANNSDIVLLKCVSSYPSKIEDMNLLTIQDIKKRFNCEVGLSDHSIGSVSAIASIGVGARVIEKHFVLDNIKSLDSSFSMKSSEFKGFVKSIKEANLTLGKVDYSYNAKNRELARSLYISCDINKGQRITKDNIKSIRPNFSLHPKHYMDILGKVVKRDMKIGDRLSLKDLK